MNITCPMHPDPKPSCNDNGLCPLCGREWEETKHGLMSKPRKVDVTGPLVAGAKLDDCIKPIKEN